jgi:hypothetical protein
MASVVHIDLQFRTLEIQTSALKENRFPQFARIGWLLAEQHAQEWARGGLVGGLGFVLYPGVRQLSTFDVRSADHKLIEHPFQPTMHVS